MTQYSLLCPYQSFLLFCHHGILLRRWMFEWFSNYLQWARSTEVFTVSRQKTLSYLLLTIKILGSAPITSSQAECCTNNFFPWLRKKPRLSFEKRIQDKAKKEVRINKFHPHATRYTSHLTCNRGGKLTQMLIFKSWKMFVLVGCIFLPYNVPCFPCRCSGHNAKYGTHTMIAKTVTK